MPNILNSLGGGSSTTDWSALLGGLSSTVIPESTSSNPGRGPNLDAARSVGFSMNTKSNPIQAVNSTNLLGSSAAGSKIPLGGIASTLLQGYSGIQNAGRLPQGAQRDAAMGDSILNTVSSGLSMFGPVGSLVGVGLNLVNGIGGSLMNNNSTAKAAKDFTLNGQVQQSSGYGGVNSNAQDAQSGGNAYRKAGLVGKLFSNTSNIKQKLATSGVQQTLAGDILSQNKQAKDSAAVSADLFGARLKNKLYNGSMWTNGSVQYGKQGLKFQAGGKVGLNPTQQKPTLNSQPKANTTQLSAPPIPTLMQGMQPTQQPVLVRQKIEDKGDKKIDFNQQVAVAKKSLTPKALELPQPATFFSNDIMGMLTAALTPATAILQDGGTMTAEASKKKVGIPTHKEGGAMNVIVDGALHARKHELHDHPDFEEASITSKGIPVVTKSEGGEIEQHAEVERDELILHYELTKQLEALMDEGDENAAIRAGELLAREIVKNTKDSKSKILKVA